MVSIGEPLTQRLRGFGASIFAEMTALAIETGAINLGQGFPDYNGPQEVLNIAQRNIEQGANQYPPGIGVPDLRQAISEHQKRFWNLSYDPDSEVLVTMGATEALAGAILGILNEGDEVIVFEPLFDTYAGCVALAGAVLSPVTLRPQDNGRYGFDPDELRRSVNKRTRMILLNSPHNPTGMVFTRDELELVADVARENDLIVISDEVYEHLTFDNAVHIPIASLSDMRERTITISSGGKSFNTTGWKIGWACGPSELISATRMAKQLFTFAGGTPFQSAIAAGLRLPDSYFLQLAVDLQNKRNILLSALSDTGLSPISPEGTYFITADISNRFPKTDSLTFCRTLPHDCGVVAIPGGVLYDPRHSDEGKHVVRFAFCKQEATLFEAAERLRAWA